MVKLFSDIQIGDTIYKVTKTKKVVPAKVFALGKSLFGENTTFYYEGSKVPFTANPCLPFAKDKRGNITFATEENVAYSIILDKLQSRQAFNITKIEMLSKENERLTKEFNEIIGAHSDATPDIIDPYSYAGYLK